MSRRKTYYDLQRKGGRILREIALNIVGSELAYKQAFADKLDRPVYSISRYMESLTQRLLIADFDLLERAITEALDACSKENNLYDARAENVKRQRQLLEKKLMQELRELHDKAIQRYID